MSDTDGLPRVLVVSHNPFNDRQNNGKTLSALFEGWPRQRLAQLYFTPDTPDFTTCQNFYHVTDLDMLTLAFGWSDTAGVVAGSAGQQAATQQKQALHRNPWYRLARDVFQARWPSALLVRSWFWKQKRWLTPRLQDWLDEFDPEAIFFQSSNCTFAFRVVEELCRQRGIPLVMETTDDYVTAHPTLSPAAWLYQASITGAYRAAVARADTVFAIGERMASEYRTRFGGTWATAMNPVPTDGPRSTCSGPGGSPLILHYAGNIVLDRWRVLASIGRALQQLGADGRLDAKLEIYSLQTPSPRIRRALTIPGRCEFLGPRDSQWLAARREEAALLVHVESFDRKNRRTTRLSISTKIPEYLATGRNILAVGPGDVASIQYLRDNDVAIVVGSPRVDRIADLLAEAAADPGGLCAQRRRSIALVRRNHDKSSIQREIRDALRGAVAGGAPSGSSTG